MLFYIFIQVDLSRHFCHCSQKKNEDASPTGNIYLQTTIGMVKGERDRVSLALNPPLWVT